jgi:hypothetical protein
MSRDCLEQIGREELTEMLTNWIAIPGSYSRVQLKKSRSVWPRWITFRSFWAFLSATSVAVDPQQ